MCKLPQVVDTIIKLYDIFYRHYMPYPFPPCVARKSESIHITANILRGRGGMGGSGRELVACVYVLSESLNCLMVPGN